MIRLVLALLLIAHGVAHLVGFVVPWRLMNSAELPYRTTVLSGTLDLGDTGIRVVGILWLALAAAFIWLGVMLMMSRSPTAAVSVIVASLVLCALGWPDTRIGVVVNLVLLAVFLAQQAQWMR